MTGRLLIAYKQKLKGLTLVPSSGGCFELSANGELLYSKLKTNEFPDEAEMVSLVGQRLGSVKK